MSDRQKRREADMKAREEMRNAARMALAEQGFTKEVLQRAIAGVAEKAVLKMIDSWDFKKVINVAVKAELERQIGGGKDGANMANIVKGMIQQEAQRYAKEFIDKAVNINITGAW